MVLNLQNSYLAQNMCLSLHVNSGFHYVKVPINQSVATVNEALRVMGLISGDGTQ